MRGGGRGWGNRRKGMVDKQWVQRDGMDTNETAGRAPVHPDAVPLKTVQNCTPFVARGIIRA